MLRNLLSEQEAKKHRPNTITNRLADVKDAAEDILSRASRAVDEKHSMYVASKNSKSRDDEEDRPIRSKTTQDMYDRLMNPSNLRKKLFEKERKEREKTLALQQKILQKHNRPPQPDHSGLSLSSPRNLSQSAGALPQSGPGTPSKSSVNRPPMNDPRVAAMVIDQNIMRATATNSSKNSVAKRHDESGETKKKTAVIHGRVPPVSSKKRINLSEDVKAYRSVVLNERRDKDREREKSGVSGYDPRRSDLVSKRLLMEESHNSSFDSSNFYDPAHNYKLNTEKGDFGAPVSSGLTAARRLSSGSVNLPGSATEGGGGEKKLLGKRKNEYDPKRRISSSSSDSDPFASDEDNDDYKQCFL
eukprot:TRINITY_DN12863_c0_g1_i2.p1 TRINITY_DN12863_c0_g1~~TRINITY_DN12863_c0_g1_i2.p1  ORF type:complete len:359 (+),score=61.56 TRINITY_DN12863_c0_g1_i2:68-1144(+)